MEKRRTAALACCLLTAACGMPRDPEGTLERIEREGVLRVGLVERAPAARWEGGRPAGPEVELLARFAAELGATPGWVRAGAEDLYAGLEGGSLDLVIGAVAAKSPWSKRLAFSLPVLDTRWRVAAPDGRRLDDLAGVTVAFPAASDLGRRLERREAQSVATEDPAAAAARGTAVAAEEWWLDAAGLTPGPDLGPHRWVWAAPPGENRWLHRIDRFVVARRPALEEALRSGAAGPRAGTRETPR